MPQFCSNISAPGQAHPVLSSSHKSILLRDTTTITARSGSELSICSPSGTKTTFSFQPDSLSMLSLWFYLGIFPDAHSNPFSYSCLKFSSFFFRVQGHNLFFLLPFFFFSSQFLLFPLIIHYCLVFNSYNLCACVLSCFSCVWLFVTLQTIALQSPLSMGFSKQDYWVDCHALLQGIFLTQGSNSSLLSPALLGRFFTTSATWETLIYYWPGSKYSAFLKTKVQSNIC